MVVSDSAGNTVSGANLSAITSGSSVSVQVTLEFEAVRWIKGMDYMNEKSITTAAVMRRD